MKIGVKMLRRLIHEEILRGMPEFVIDDAAIRYCDEIRGHIKKFVQQSSKSQDDTRFILEEAEKSLDKLQEELVELTKERLSRFINNV